MSKTQFQSSTGRLLLDHLKNSGAITVLTAAALVNITPDGVRARITELRKAGYPIYTNRRTDGVNEYRLGKPTRRQLVAGALLLSKPGLARRYAKQIDRNLSLA